MSEAAGICFKSGWKRCHCASSSTRRRILLCSMSVWLFTLGDEACSECCGCSLAILVWSVLQFVGLHNTSTSSMGQELQGPPPCFWRAKLLHWWCVWWASAFVYSLFGDTTDLQVAFLTGATTTRTTYCSRGFFTLLSSTVFHCSRFAVECATMTHLCYWNLVVSWCPLLMPVTIPATRSSICMKSMTAWLGLQNSENFLIQLFL